jgi:hypothetical protein
MTMKRTIFAFTTILVIFVAVFAVLVLRPLPKVKAHHGCSDAMLKGSYGFAAFGGYGTSPSTTFPPASAVGIVTFDGKGNLSGQDISTVVGGTVLQVNGTFSAAQYSVASTCAFTATNVDLFGAVVTFNGVVVDAVDASEVVAHVASNLANVTGTIDLKEIQGRD